MLRTLYKDDVDVDDDDDDNYDDADYNDADYGDDDGDDDDDGRINHNLAGHIAEDTSLFGSSTSCRYPRWMVWRFTASSSMLIEILKTWRRYRIAFKYRYSKMMVIMILMMNIPDFGLVTTSWIP